MVYERGKDVSVGRWPSSSDAVPSVLWITAVRGLFDHRRRCGLSRAYPGYHGTAAQSERFVPCGEYCSGGQESVARDWKSLEGEIWWEIAAPQGEVLRGYREYDVGDPNRVTLHRGGDPCQVRVSVRHEARRSV